MYLFEVGRITLLYILNFYFENDTNHLYLKTSNKIYWNRKQLMISISTTTKWLTVNLRGNKSLGNKNSIKPHDNIIRVVN